MANNDEITSSLEVKINTILKPPSDQNVKDVKDWLKSINKESEDEMKKYVMKVIFDLVRK